MKNTFIITLLLLFSSALLKAQDTLKLKHNPQPDSIIRQVPVGYGRYSSDLYMVGKQIVTPQEVIIRLQSYQPSAAELQKARHTFTWSWVTFTGGLATSVIGAISLYHNSKNYGATTDFNPTTGRSEFVYQHHNKVPGFIFTGIGIELITTGFVTLVHAGRHSRNAVHIYNLQYQ